MCGLRHCQPLFPRLRPMSASSSEVIQASAGMPFERSKTALASLKVWYTQGLALTPKATHQQL